jgi:hypothetical protein
MHGDDVRPAMSLEGIIWLTIIVGGLLAWGVVSLWNMTGLSGETGMLVFWVLLAVVIIGVGGRMGWMIVRTAVQMYIVLVET